MCLARKLKQIAITRQILRQQRDVRLRSTTSPFRRCPLMPRSKRNIPLHPDDRLDTRRLRCLVEIDRGVDVAMVRQRHRRLTKLGGSIDHVLDMTVSVEKRILRVIVKMYELVRQRLDLHLRVHWEISGDHVEPRVDSIQYSHDFGIAATPSRPVGAGFKPAPDRHTSQSRLHPVNPVPAYPKNMYAMRQ